MTSRSMRLIAAVAIVAAIAGYRLLATKPGADGDGKGHAPAASAAPVAPLQPQRWGRIAFTPCSLASPFGRESLDALCATFAVPEDRGNPNDRTIALNIAWLEATGKGQAPDDAVFFLAGGPGQAAVATYPTLDGVFRDVRKRRHVVLVDQRGTGKSNPLSCELDGGEADDADASPQAMRAQAARCAETLSKKADLRHYTTTDAVADLEAVRQALGVKSLDLVGVSYGTRVAQQYAMRHPASTRALVLDSVVPNALGLGNIFARNLDDALALQFALCTKNPACKEAVGDPRAELDALLAKLRAQPMALTYRDAGSGEAKQGTLRAEHVAGLVRMYAYMPLASSLLPKLIHEANAGHAGGLMALAKMMGGEMKEAMAMGMQLSVVCSEDAQSMVASDADEGTVLGKSMPEGMAAMCAAWPRAAMPADFHAPLATKVPALVLEGEFDPVTPPRYGEQVVKSLPNARLLVLRGQGHNVIGAGCMPKLFAQFIEKADARALDATCLDKLAYVQPFTGFNGAGP